MFIIDKYNRIKLTKGDTATIFCQVFDIDKKPYEIKSDDVITMTIKTSQGAQAAALTKTADSAHYIIINHSDTASLSTGLYVYDVQLVTSDGKYYTIIPTNYFELLNEVSA